MSREYEKNLSPKQCAVINVALNTIVEYFNASGESISLEREIGADNSHNEIWLKTDYSCVCQLGCDFNLLLNIQSLLRFIYTE